MYGLFYKYLILNQKADIPGLGNFIIESIPARMDIVRQSLTAPSQSFSFHHDKAVTDKSFFQFLAREMNVSEMEAINRFNGFSRKIKDNALHGGIDMPGIGTLGTNNEGEIFFHPIKKQFPVFSEIRLNLSPAANANLVDLYDSGETKIITQETEAPPEEKIVMKEKEDYWWVYAIVLALMGLGALLYYYI